MHEFSRKIRKSEKKIENLLEKYRENEIIFEDLVQLKEIFSESFLSKKIKLLYNFLSFPP